MTQKILISANTLRSVIADCVKTSIEKVYIGVGVKEGYNYIVGELYECTNVSENPTYSFTADPICVFNVYTRAEAIGKELVVLVHSHPGPPYPSPEDMSGMKLWRMPWLIISSLNGDYRAWILQNSELQEVEIVTET